ncbi:hypothetical protein [Streptomyces sp. enrichment culture]|uniref:hypothetical protein n=1 Tax=Streptomyces sp. enrichment culture TaxID=1795815 RepID=UPI003F55CAA4
MARALSRIGDPRALAESRLVGTPVMPTVSSLRTWLRDAVLELGADGSPADAEAGAILQSYHLGGAANHHQVAVRLHLSRATYFRRRGHETLATRLATTAATATTPHVPVTEGPPGPGRDAPWSAANLMG